MPVQNTTMITLNGNLTFDKPAPSFVTPQYNSARSAAFDSLPSSTDTITQSSTTISPPYQGLSDAKSKLNAVAGSVRQADETMENIGRTVDKMKGTLEGIVKNSPPFPPGSEKRIAFLKSFAGLRKELEELTYPPDSSLAPKQRMAPEPASLNIPVLPVSPPEDSSDKPIHAAIAALSTASAAIDSRRQSLSDNFTNQALPAVAVSLNRQTGNSDVNRSGAKLTEQAAQSQSHALQGIFSALSVGISSAGTSFMRQLL
jgi:hypothetical protein